MLREVGESSTSGRRREVQREVLLDSPAHFAPLPTSVKDPPPYGAQHRQDALWEGGSEALPPLWHEYNVLHGRTIYHDDTLTMPSWKRPLPGVRLDDPGQIIAGYEWHISPLGRSYFANHDTQTTSWKKPTPKRPAGSLTPECIIEGHSKCIWSLACLGTGCNIISTSADGSIRQWKRDGESVGKPWDGDGREVQSIAVSPDEAMVVCGSIDNRLRLWNIRKSSMVGDPWEGHSGAVRCLDWSPNALEIVSGSQDGTIRRWSPDTGRQVTPPIETSHGWVDAVKYSPQGDKVMSGGSDSTICVWSRVGELLIRIKGHEDAVISLCWSKDGAHIFSGSLDDTIRKWRSTDGQELVVLQGHTRSVTSLCLSPSESHLVSASLDCSVRIWDLKTNQPVGDPLLHDDNLLAVAIFPDVSYIASAGIEGKIYIWSMEAAHKQHGGNKTGGAGGGNAKPKANYLYFFFTCISPPSQGRPARPRDILDSRPVSKQQTKNRGLARYGDDFWGNNTHHAPGHTAPPTSPSLPHWLSLFRSLRFSARPTDTPRTSPRESGHWNFNLFPASISRHTVYVAPARDEDRYGITPETDAEAAAAMEHTNYNEADSSTQSGSPAAGVQVSQVRPIPTQAQSSTAVAEDILYEGVSCCGFFFGRSRPVSHQS